LYPHDPKKSLQNPKEVLETLLHCLSINDIEAFQDVLIAYLMHTSKTDLARKTKLGRRTLYDLLDRKKPFNPTLSTIGPLFKALAENRVKD
jgi:DNA-binding phage protein